MGSQRTLLNATPIATRRSGVAWPPDIADRKPFAGIAVSSSHSNHETAAQAGGMYNERRVLQQFSCIVVEGWSCEDESTRNG